MHYVLMYSPVSTDYLLYIDVLDMKYKHAYNEGLIMILCSYTPGWIEYYVFITLISSFSVFKNYQEELIEMLQKLILKRLRLTFQKWKFCQTYYIDMRTMF